MLNKDIQLEGRGGSAASRRDDVPSPVQMIPRIYYNSHRPGTKTTISRIDTPPHGVENPTPLSDRWLAGGHGVSDTRAGYNSTPRPEIILLMYNSNTPGTKVVIPGLILPPTRCGNPVNIGRLLIGSSSWSQRAARVSCPSGQRRRPAAPGDDNLSSRIRKLAYIYKSNTLGPKTVIPRFDIPSRTVWKPHPHR